MTKITVFLIIIASIIPLSTEIYAKELDVPQDVYELYINFPIAYRYYAYEKCRENDLSYAMFLAVAYNESRFNVDAYNINKNNTIDRGLCQINDACFAFLASKGIITESDELFNPCKNIDCYIALMRYHKDATNNDSKALLRYQVGEGAYRRRYDNGNETNSTHQRVLQIAEAYKVHLANQAFVFENLLNMQNKPCSDRLIFKNNKYDISKRMFGIGGIYYELCTDLQPMRSRASVWSLCDTSNHCWLW